MAGGIRVGVRSPLLCAPVALTTRISSFRGTRLCPRRRFKRQIRLRGYSPCPGSYFMDVFRLRGHTVVDQKPHDSAIFAKPHDFSQNLGVPPQLELSRFSAAGAHQQGTPASPASDFGRHNPHDCNLTRADKTRASPALLCVTPRSGTTPTAPREGPNSVCHVPILMCHIRQLLTNAHQHRLNGTKSQKAKGTDQKPVPHRAPDPTRTGNRRIRRPWLYPLSYRGISG